MDNSVATTCYRCGVEIVVMTAGRVSQQHRRRARLRAPRPRPRIASRDHDGGRCVRLAPLAARTNACRYAQQTRSRGSASFALLAHLLGTTCCRGGSRVSYRPVGRRKLGGGGAHGRTSPSGRRSWPRCASLGLRGGDDEQRPGVIHRLDRDTSGLLVLARSDEAYAALGEQMRARADRARVRRARARPPALAPRHDRRADRARPQRRRPHGGRRPRRARRP